MRLLYVCNDFGIAPNGTKGASVHLRAITRALAERGHEIRLLSPGEGPDGDHPAVRVLPPGCPHAGTTIRSLKRWLEAHTLDTAAARELRPLLYNAWAPEAAARALADAPPDVIIERLSLLSHVGLDLAAHFDVPLIVEVNALMTDEASRFRSMHAAALAEQIEQRVLERADALVVVSGALGEALVARGVARERVQVIPNGADVKRFAGGPDRAMCKHALDLEGRFVVGFVGSLKIWHGVDILLNAFARFAEVAPDARLVVVGEGPTRADLEALAARLGVGDRVMFTGSVVHEQVPSYVAAMDVAVAPFKHVEGFYFSPLKLFEYMAAGTCIVASRLGQIEEVITDNVNGLLCAPDDPAALAGLLHQAHRSQELRARLGDTACGDALTHHSWRRVARDTERAIEQAVARRTDSIAA